MYKKCVNIRTADPKGMPVFYKDRIKNDHDLHSSRQVGPHIHFELYLPSAAFFLQERRPSPGQERRSDIASVGGSPDR